MAQPFDIEAARATLTYRTPGNLIAVEPRSQEGGVAIAHAGPSYAKDFPAPTSIRRADGDPLERLTWEECAHNAEAIVVAWNALPGLLAILDERDAEIAGLAAALRTETTIKEQVQDELVALRMKRRGEIASLTSECDAWRLATGCDSPEALAAELNAYRASLRPKHDRGALMVALASAGAARVAAAKGVDNAPASGPERAAACARFNEADAAEKRAREALDACEAAMRATALEGDPTTAPVGAQEPRP